MRWLLQLHLACGVHVCCVWTSEHKCERTCVRSCEQVHVLCARASVCTHVHVRACAHMCEHVCMCVATWNAHALLWHPASLRVGKGPGGKEGREPGSSPNRAGAGQAWEGCLASAQASWEQGPGGNPQSSAGGTIATQHKALAYLPRKPALPWPPAPCCGWGAGPSDFWGSMHHGLWGLVPWKPGASSWFPPNQGCCPRPGSVSSFLKGVQRCLAPSRQALWTFPAPEISGLSVLLG